MPILLIIILILFAIGLLLVKDPTKLPPFLQIIRQGLATGSKFLLFLIPIGGLLLWAAVAWNQNSKEEYRQAQIELYQQDSLRRAIEESRNKELAAKPIIEGNQSNSNTKENSTSGNLNLVGNWSRMDSTYSGFRSNGSITIKSDNRFYNSRGVEGNYEYNSAEGRLYLNFDGGETEILKFDSISDRKIYGVAETDNNTKFMLIKKSTMGESLEEIKKKRQFDA